MKKSQPGGGRLVLVVDTVLREESRRALKKMLFDFAATRDVTMVAGMHRASVMAAARVGKGVVYNMKDPLTPEEACRMMAWREVWLVAAGHVWCLSSAGLG